MVPSREDLFKYFGISHMVNNDTIVYLCHQTIFKMVPEFDRVFRYVASVSVTHDIDLMLQLCRDILKRNPNAILLGKVFAQHITFVLYLHVPTLLSGVPPSGDHGALPATHPRVHG